MLYYLLFGGSLILLILLTATAAYFVLQKKSEEEEDFPKIHRSGAFSIINSNPSMASNKKKLALSEVKDALKDNEADDKEIKQANKYLNLWNEIFDKSLEIIESGDRDDLQTFCYEVPKENETTCNQFSGNVYVTREQLQNHPELIPPFHLGCKVELKHKHAWNTNMDGTGWKALLPQNGKYKVPDWRIVEKI